MADWLKILISALAGVTTALLSDTLRMTLARKVAVNRIRRLIAPEMFVIVNELWYFWRCQGSPTCEERLRRIVRFDVFDHYSTQNKETFLEIPYVWLWRELYDGAKEIIQETKSPLEERLYKIEKLLRNVYLNQRLFGDAVYPEGVQRFVKRELSQKPFSEVTKGDAMLD